jgi:hypothetical protein
MDNLNFTMEGMTRTIRFGTHYHCNPDFAQLDCALGGDVIEVISSDNKTVRYSLDPDTRQIIRTTDGFEYRITGTDVTIDSLRFRVMGAPPFSTGNDTAQPRVVITVSGHAGTKATTQSSFNLQTMVSQRQFDSQ